ncbi:MAG: hypothetical protein NT121_07025, partial [Chloroflexi bacterium]|nr:hypothetical protein [Chloroflexota bacterium]
MKFSEMLKRPIVVAALAIILGLALGLVWGWVIQPVEWYNAPVSLLRADLQDEYLRMTIDSLRVTGDENLAVKRYTDLGSNGYDLLQGIKANPGKQDPNSIAQLEQLLMNKNAYAPGETQPESTGTASAGVSIAIILGGLLAVA